MERRDEKFFELKTHPCDLEGFEYLMTIFMTSYEFEFYLVNANKVKTKPVLTQRYVESSNSSRFLSKSLREF